MALLAGLEPGTCVLVVDRIELLWDEGIWDDWDRRVGAYDLIQYGCSGANRVELHRQRMPSADPNKAAMTKAILERVISDVNRELAKRPHCHCA